jgi:hypothetical protein
MTKENLLTHENLVVFRQFGFIPRKVTGNNVSGDCPFCGGEGKFFVNPETKKWDCKKCTRSGGYQSFIQDMFQESLEDSNLEDLSKHRGIKSATLKRFKIGYLPVCGKYTIPHGLDDKCVQLADLRLYNMKELRSAQGCYASLFNYCKLVTGDYETIFLCEGEWDTMVADEIIHALNLEKTLAVGVPGAGTFKPEWIPFFREKKVFVIYDNDHPREVKGKQVRGAGEMGMNKVHSMLATVVESIKYIHWSKGLENGYDLRDLYKDRNYSPQRTYRGICRLCNPLPPGYIGEVEAIKFSDNMVPYKSVHNVYSKWLHLTDTNVIDVLYATIIANRIPGDPLWLFLIAKSGDAKSVLLMSYITSPQVYIGTSFTQNTLISGFGSSGGVDPSLIPRLKEKVLVIKDFTTILTVNPMERDAIFGILRDIYDGRIDKAFGNGVYRSYQAHFGFLAGVTPAIELYIDGHTALGERFLSYRLRGSDEFNIERLLCRKAIDNTSFEKEMNRELSEIAKKTLSFDYSSIKVKVSEEIKEKIISLAQWTATLRGSINRDKYSKEITHKPFCERPTRLSKQFYKLLLALGQFRGLTNVTNAEYLIIRDVGRSTVPSRMEDILSNLYKEGAHKEFSISTIGEMMKLPSITIQRMVENLCMLNVLVKTKTDAGVLGKVTYRIHDHILKLIKEADIYETIS